MDPGLNLSASASAGSAGEELPHSPRHVAQSGSWCTGPAPGSPEAAAERGALSSSTGGMTCAICLECIDPANLALIPECEHQYCATCILHWAVHKEACWCPQCRVPFSRLETYRSLDGSLRDYPAAESVCLLKRTAWFQDYVQAKEKGKAPAAVASDPSVPQEVMDWHDYGRFYDEYDDEEEVEAYYFSSAAGRARITLGNRRWGENGYISSGRMHARPVAPARPSKGSKAGKGGPASGSSPGSRIPDQAAQTPAHTQTRRAGPSSGTSPSSQGPLQGPSASGGRSGSLGRLSEGKAGRRSRRNARRAAADARTACVLEGD